MGVSSNMGYHLAFEASRLSQTFFDYHEPKVHGMVQQLERVNTQLSIVSKVMHALATGKQEKKQVDLNEVEDVQKCAYLLSLGDPSLFQSKIHGASEEGITLDQKLQQITEGLVQSGVPLEQVDLRAILDAMPRPNVHFDILSVAEADIMTTGLDSKTKMFSNEVNERMMHINTEFDTRSQVIEIIRKIIQESADLVRSINQKTGR